MKMYSVITCDVIDSKKHENFDNLLKEKIEILNKEIKDIVTYFTISRGDEVQGILSYDRNLFRNIKILRGLLYPLKLRIGVGVGKIEGENIDNINSWNMNGEIFHLARNGLSYISKEKIIKTQFMSKEKSIANILNSFFILHDSIIGKWNERNWEIALSYEETLSYAETANRFGISRSGMWQKIKAMKFDVILESEKYLIRELFKEEN